MLSPGEALSSVFITENWMSAGSERRDICESVIGLGREGRHGDTGQKNTRVSRLLLCVKSTSHRPKPSKAMSYKMLMERK